MITVYIIAQNEEDAIQRLVHVLTVSDTWVGDMDQQPIADQLFDTSREALAHLGYQKIEEKWSSCPTVWYAHAKVFALKIPIVEAKEVV